MPPRDPSSGGRRPPAPGAGAVADAGLLDRRVLAFALLSLTVFVAVMTLFKMSNNDIWIHLKTGEYVLENGWVPIKDPYSFIASDRDYVAHEWLAGVLFYLVYSAGGVTALIWFKAAVLAASCVLLLLTARILNGRLSVILPSFTILLYIATARFLERPHIFSYLMAALYLWLFFMYRERGRNLIWLYALLPAHSVWTNLHGGYVQGLAMVATFALGETLIWARARYLRLGREGALPGRDVALLAGLLPGCVLATLLNPYGYRALTFPFELTGLKLFMQSIYEWQPPYHLSYNSSTMFIFYLVHIGVLCAAFFVTHRDRKGPAGREFDLLHHLPLAAGFVLAALFFVRRPPLNVQVDATTSVLYFVVGLALMMGLFALRSAAAHVISGALALVYLALALVWSRPGTQGWTPTFVALCLSLLLGLFCAFVVTNYRSVDFTHAGLFALFFILSLRHNRAVTDAALGTFPILVAAVSRALDLRSSSRQAAASRSGPRRGGAGAPESPPAPGTTPVPVWRDRSAPVPVILGSLLLLGVSVHAYFWTYYFDFRGSGREKGFGIADNMPVCAVDFIEKKNITGNAFVSYPFAAMLIHRMHPRVKVNMDSRNDVYLEDLYLEYMGALRNPTSMRDYLQKHPIDFFMLAYGDRSPAVFQYLESTGQWAPVYYDNRGFILVKRKPETEALVSRETFRVIKPAVVAPTIVDSSNAPQVLEESERLIANCPGASFARYYQTRALYILHRYEESLAAARAAAELDPRNPQAYADMGAAYAALQQPDRAIEMLEQALRIDPGFAEAEDNLKRLRGF